MGIKKIAIIGYGQLGRAIHGLLKNRVDLIIETWDKNGSADQKELSSAISGAEVVFICVPSWHVREAISAIKKYLDKLAIVVCLAKGIEENSLKTMDAVMSDELPKGQSLAILGGPMLAEELSAGKNGFAAVAIKSRKDFRKIFGIFKETRLIITYSSDLKGVAFSGVLKNIYALGLGIVDGLDLGKNTKGSLVAMAIGEMRKINKILGGKDITVLGNAGLGDLVSTGFSQYSRNRETGEGLGKTGICCLESEGYRSLASIVGLLGKNKDKFPFLIALASIVLDNKKPADVFRFFIS
ncbi:MAG: hypothetical protein M1155_03015 [Patescibacteria group bacterium]|nr:hypothetical protein [Patescibacteria group bacterium]